MQTTRFYDGGYLPARPVVVDETAHRQQLPGRSRHRFGVYDPLVNIRETRDGFRIEVTAPGLRREAFRIELNGALLHIEAENQNPLLSGEDRWLCRTIWLPEYLRHARPDVRYERGILHIDLLETEPAIHHALMLETI